MSPQPFNSLNATESVFQPHDSLDHTASPVYVFYDGHLVLNANSSTIHYLDHFSGIAASDTMFVGHFGGVAHFAIELFELPEAFETVHLREYLDDSTNTFHQAGRALQFIAWDKTHRFCGCCGSATVRGYTEWVRRCTTCEHSFYPRLSPCVIMAIRKGNSILLAQRPAGLTKRHTVLAGFIEPGESAEHAVRREVWEEARLEIKNLRYVSSQPWPFPGQLMLGYLADYTSGELTPDEEELLNASWYDYRNLPDHPSVNTIAGRLINQIITEINAGN